MLLSNRCGYLFLAVAYLELLAFTAPSIATPLPMPLALMMADYSPSFSSANHSIFNGLYGRDADLLYPRPTRQPNSATDLRNIFIAAQSHANDLKGLAARSASVDDNDSAFQRDCVAALTGFNTNMDNFKTALVDVTSASGTSDKGLANYDSTNDLETLLKEAINLNKGVLKATYQLVDELPVIGPILGPIVYDIKCWIIEVLNLVENSTDAIINKLQPLLQELLGKAVTSSCKPGVMLAGLCI